MAALTASDVARRLGLTECTVRYYHRRFAAYIPSIPLPGAPRYPPDAFPVFREIARRLRAGARVEAVEAWLRYYAVAGDSAIEAAFFDDWPAPLIKAWQVQHRLEQENAALRDNLDALRRAVQSGRRK